MTLLGLQVLLQMLIGFYAVVTQIEEVYEVAMPADVKELLRMMKITFSLGLADHGSVLTCMGVRGYLASISFWICLPLVLTSLVLAGVTLWLATTRTIQIRSGELR